MSESNSVERVLTGTVVSASRDKTIAVLVERKVRHPIYKKYIKQCACPKHLTFDTITNVFAGHFGIIRRPIGSAFRSPYFLLSLWSSEPSFWSSEPSFLLILWTSFPSKPLNLLTLRAWEEVYLLPTPSCWTPFRPYDKKHVKTRKIM